MNLEATCGTCNRRFLLGQLTGEPEGTGGRCPNCGTRFARHYVAVLPETVLAFEDALLRLEASLQRLQGMRPGFTIDIPGALTRLEELGTGTAV